MNGELKLVKPNFHPKVFEITYILQYSYSDKYYFENIFSTITY